MFIPSFRCSDSGVLDRLLEEFGARGVARRVLAVLPGQEFVPGPESLTPLWASSAVDGR